jgi:hypothetical protein
MHALARLAASPPHHLSPCRSLRTEEFVEHFAQFGTIEDAVVGGATNSRILEGKGCWHQTHTLLVGQRPTA